MDDIRWLEAQADRQTIDELVGCDHRRIAVDGEDAVLISYSSTTSPDRGVLAVFHPAARHYPAVPAEIQELVARLSWTDLRAD